MIKKQTRFAAFALAMIAGNLIPQPIAASSDAIMAVQSKVNLTLKFESEADGKDVWKIPTRYADCEDYALLKRKMLIEDHGFDPDDLQILLILRPIAGKKNVKEGHAVLYVKSKDLILDNPPAENKRQNLAPLSMIKYVSNGNKVYCVFGDISTEKQYSKVTDRCIKT